MLDSEFKSLQQQAGGVFSESSADAPFARHFGDPAAEFHAARHASAVFELSDRTQIELSGKDAIPFLHNLCTNDIKSLANGTGCEAFITNAKARVLGHVFVFVGENSVMLETVPDAEEALTTHLERYVITEDVTLHGRTAEYGELLVTGPGAAGVLTNFNVDAGSLPLFGHVAAQISGANVSVRRVDLVGSPGYLLSVPTGRLTETWTTLTQAGARPAGSAAFHGLRICACMPLYGVDISEENLAQEVARTAKTISFTKGCYLGQEPIARIAALGHVNRELRGLRLAAGPAAERGDPILADEAEIGHVTSAAVDYEAVDQKDDRTVALGYIKRGHMEPGSEVQVRSKDKLIPATVFWTEN